MEQQHPTSEPSEARQTNQHETTGHGERQNLKTLAVRLDENIHAQLRLIAQLSGHSLTEEIRLAIDARIQAAQDDPALVARAHEARHQIEQDAAVRTAALAGFIGKPAVATVVGHDQETGAATGAAGSRQRRSKTSNE